MKAIVLVDNIGNGQLQGEWGLSILIEHEGRKVLLDAGQSPLFATNAKLLGIDLAAVDFAVLSHAHYDHANGFPAFFELNASVPVYLSRACAENCYSRIKGEYDGICPGMLKRFGDRFIRLDGVTELDRGITVVTHSTPGLEKEGHRQGQARLVDGELVDDAFDHELTLVVETQSGLVVFNSCSHAGAEVIVEEVRQAFPEKHICAYVGGLHLFRFDEHTVRAYAKRMQETGISCIYTGHCTGEDAFGILREEFGEAAHQLRCGMKIEIA